MISIARAVSGISLNGIEYLVDANNEIVPFKDKEEVFKHLRDTDYSDFTDEEIEDSFIFNDIEE